MRYSFSDEQVLLRETVSRYLSANYTREARRKAIGGGGDRAIWAGMAELGLLGLPFAEAHGGIGGGPLEAAIVMEEFGRALVAEPYLPVVILAGAVLKHGASQEQSMRLIPPLAKGERVCVLAHSEPRSRYSISDVQSVALRDGRFYVLNGRKSVVLGAPDADTLLVSARTSGSRYDQDGISIFAIDAQAPGVRRRDYRTIDGLAASEIELADVRVGEEDLLGREGEAFGPLKRAIAEATCAACAEAVGIMEALNERTLEHTRTRVAFGQPLSKFQVIQHRLVDMHVAYEYAAAAALRAAIAIGEGLGPATDLAVAAAGYQVGRDADFVGKQAVQLHGAIGITDELDVSHYFRRLTGLRALFGPPDHHLRQYVELRQAGIREPEDELDLGEADRSFQAEVREFIAEHLTEPMREAARNTVWALAEFDYGRQWQQALHAKGWGAPDWPVEYGGCDWTPTQRMVWELENARAGAPETMRMGRNLCAPCIMKFGTDAQRAEFLPAILSGDDWWAQGYSEPGAGSDLASLRLSAIPDGDDYVLNGSKIWTTFAHHGNRIFCLVRTSSNGKKQAGITFLLIDMDTPGIEVRPIINMAGDHEFNEVFFTDVRVPKSRRLGEENRGWDVARHLLRFEHGAGLVRANAQIRQRLEWVRSLAAQEPDGRGGAMLDDLDFGRRLAKAEITCLALQFAASQALAGHHAAVAPPAVAELLNIRSREVGQDLTQLAVDAIGRYAAPFQPDARRVGSGIEPVGPRHAVLPTPLFLSQRAATIAGGTPEVHRNNLARNYLNI